MLRKKNDILNQFYELVKPIEKTALEQHNPNIIEITVQTITERIKNKKIPDNLRNKLIKYGVTPLLEELTQLVNRILSHKLIVITHIIISQ